MDRNNLTSGQCIKGCGFYGSKENKSMCSQCYNDDLKAQILISSAKSTEKTLKSWPPLWISSSSKTSCSSNNNNAAGSGGGGGGDGDSSGSRLKRRCEKCNKKVGLIEFKCRCGHLYCGTHRYPQEHACTFDFKKFDRQILVKENPLIKSDKLDSRI